VDTASTEKDEKRSGETNVDSRFKVQLQEARGAEAVTQDTAG